MAERDLDQLRRVSEALDDEGPMPDHLDAEGEAFLATASRLRSLLRVEEAIVPPDVTDAVLEQIRASRSATGRRRQRPLLLVAAAVFVVAALATGLLVRSGGPLGPEPVLADVGDDVLEAQADVFALDAELTLVEHGAHPDLPVRRYAGTLRYQAPERLWLHLEEQTARPASWPANDVELVVDERLAWSTGLRDCPVGQQSGCLRSPETRLVTEVAPFAADHVAPLDLVIPAGAFLPSADLSTTEVDGAIVLETTVARLQQTIDGLRAGGALRSVHPTDRVRLELNRDTFTIRHLTVFAGGAPSRTTWAATNGYTEAAGTEILDLSVRVTALPDSPFPDPPTAAARPAGFDDRDTIDAPAPAYLPPDYSAHRSGVLATSGPDLTIRSWSNGRAWIRLDTTTDPTGETLLGGIGPIARQVRVGDGVGYTDPAGRIVSLHTDTLDLALTGSVPLDTLVRVAASLLLRGEALPDSWPQGNVLDELPDGALGPDGPLIARYDGTDLVVAVPGPGATSAVLNQRPGTRLDPPTAEVVTAPVRGVTGRYDPRAGVLSWVEDGWVRDLRSDGLDLAALQRLAEHLERQ